MHVPIQYSNNSLQSWNLFEWMPFKNEKRAFDYFSHTYVSNHQLHFDIILRLFAFLLITP